MDALLPEFAALLVYGPALVLLHELGHAAFARAGGYRVTSFGVGLGRPMWSIQLSGPVVFHIDQWVLAGGACVAIPNGPPTAKRIWFHGGGLLVQAFLAGVLLLLPEHWLVDRIAQFNLLVALTNLLPWRVGGQASDGWHILDAMSGGRRAGSVLRQRGHFEHMSEREFAVGSPMGLAYADLCVAWADVLAGRLEEAGDFFRDDPPETAAHAWTDAVYHYVKAEWHRGEGRPLAALHTAREGLASLDPALGYDAAALISLAEARAAVQLDAPAQARRALDRVLGATAPVAIQALPIVLWCALDGETDDLELATWKVARRTAEPWLDPADPVHALWEAADELARRGRLAASRGAREAAATLAAHFLAGCAPEDHRTLSWRLGAAASVESAASEGRAR